MRNAKYGRLLRAIVLTGIALWCIPSFAQATYTYTGPNFTSIYKGIPDVTYTAADHITATLRLDEWLPSNASCLDVTKISGFSLEMGDGVHPPQQALTPEQGSVQAIVSTDALGNITHWILHVYLYPFQNPDTQFIIYSDDGTYCDAAGYYDFSQVEPLTIVSYNFSGGSTVANTGTWKTPDGEALATMLISDFQLGALPEGGHGLIDKLQDVADDLSHKKNDVCRDLADIADEVNTLTTENKFSAKESTFLLQTLSMIQSENDCLGQKPTLDSDLHYFSWRGR